MSLYPGIDHFISLEDAAALTKKFRDESEDLLDPDHRGLGTLSLCESFNRSLFDTILAQTGCEGIRIYSGLNEEYKTHLVIVGVNGDDEDMVPEGEEAIEKIGQDGIRCPTNCPSASPLNTD